MKSVEETLQTIIAKTDAKPIGGGGYLGHCPCSGHVHGDANPSLTFCIANNGKILITCQSQHHTFTEICAALGIDEKDCFPIRRSRSRRRAQTRKRKTRL